MHKEESAININKDNRKPWRNKAIYLHRCLSKFFYHIINWIVNVIAVFSLWFFVFCFSCFVAWSSLNIFIECPILGAFLSPLALMPFALLLKGLKELLITLSGVIYPNNNNWIIKVDQEMISLFFEGILFAFLGLFLPSLFLISIYLLVLAPIYITNFFQIDSLPQYLIFFFSLIVLEYIIVRKINIAISNHNWFDKTNDFLRILAEPLLAEPLSKADISNILLSDYFAISIKDRPDTIITPYGLKTRLLIRGISVKLHSK